jgi:hypothetical protein
VNAEPRVAFLQTNQRQRSFLERREQVVDLFG